MRRALRPAVWLALLLAATFGMTSLRPLFASWFPKLERPVYVEDSFAALLLAHLELVAVAGVLSGVIGMAIGIAVTRPWGMQYRGLAETVSAAGQTFPPVAVLAIAVPSMGFGPEPAVVALLLYGLLPVVQNTIAGLTQVSSAVLDAAVGLGFGPFRRLWLVELPLAAPLILTGLRVSVIITIGTAAIASTVGVTTLGSPILLGLTVDNTAYVLQGAVLIGLLALAVDSLFEAITTVFQTMPLTEFNPR